MPRLLYHRNEYTLTSSGALNAILDKIVVMMVSDNNVLARAVATDVPNKYLPQDVK